MVRFSLKAQNNSSIMKTIALLLTLIFSTGILQAKTYQTAVKNKEQNEKSKAPVQENKSNSSPALQNNQPKPQLKAAPAQKAEPAPNTVTKEKDQSVKPSVAPASKPKVDSKSHSLTKPVPAKNATQTREKPPVKKDGTPDKRYKANKQLKKDGQPDMRYKENKEKLEKSEKTELKKSTAK
jgi:hypothetical protein